MGNKCTIPVYKIGTVFQESDYIVQSAVSQFLIEQGFSYKQMVQTASAMHDDPERFGEFGLSRKEASTQKSLIMFAQNHAPQKE